LHGLRRSFSLLGEAAGAPAGAIAQVMGHRPSATAEGYRPRSVDALRPFLLCGSDKGDQDRAIRRAIGYLNDWKQRGKP